jgi:hypothetical protein
MTEDTETIELQEIYSQADEGNKKNMVSAAAQLLKAQESLKNNQYGSELQECKKKE